MIQCAALRQTEPEALTDSVVTTVVSTCGELSFGRKVFHGTKKYSKEVRSEWLQVV